ncbi:hypothetical protein TA3x_003971 [Tundrisphaera sp. TA3]|uniref:hypothetical protein n=1 Tax=Tundrisphaera sp. TA3 TaxID=3435775 RepID=UPI003EBE6E31
MGVEYRHYLIPEDNTFRPGPEELCRLVDALIGGDFVAVPGSDRFARMSAKAYSSYNKVALETGCFIDLGDDGRPPFDGRVPFACPPSAQDIAALGDRDYRLVWPVESSNESGLEYPLTPFPEWGDAYYDLELRMAGDYVYHCSGLIDPFDDVACRCGLGLDYSEDDTDAALDRLLVFHETRIRRLCPGCGTQFRPQDRTARVRDGRSGEVVDRPGGATYRFAIVVDCGKGFAREGWPMRASQAFLKALEGALGRRFYQVGDIY